MRFKLLHLAPVILRNSKTLQGIWETKSFEKIRIHSRTDTVMRDVTYYEFVAVVENMRVKLLSNKQQMVKESSGASFRFGASTKRRRRENCTVVILWKIEYQKNHASNEE